MRFFIKVHCPIFDPVQMGEIDQLLKEFSGLELSGLLVQAFQFGIWALLILLLSWLARKGINSTIHDNAMRYRARKVVRLASFSLIVLLAVISFTGKIQYFSVAIGLLSAGIVFALQEVILSLAGWISIFSSNIYKPGDRIEVKKVKGDVIDISLTKTTLMEIGEWVSSDNYSGRIVQISNAIVFKEVVHNYSTDFPFVWDEINLPIRYGSDIDLTNRIVSDIARESLTEYADFAKKHWKHIVNKYLIEDANIEPTLSLKLTDNWIEFNLRYVVDYKKRRITKNKLYTKIYEAINNTKGKVTFASATIELTGLHDLNVDVKAKDDQSGSKVPKKK